MISVTSALLNTLFQSHIQGFTAQTFHTVITSIDVTFKGSHSHGRWFGSLCSYAWAFLGKWLNHLMLLVNKNTKGQTFPRVTSICILSSVILVFINLIFVLLENHNITAGAVWNVKHFRQMLWNIQTILALFNKRYIKHHRTASIMMGVSNPGIIFGNLINSPA